MSKLEVDKIDPQSGTDLELGTSGDTITIPTGVTLDASNATTTLPANVVTTDGTQTLTNKTIDASQLTGTITPSDGTVTNAKVNASAAIDYSKLNLTGNIALTDLSATGTKDATTFLRGDNTFASAGGDNTPSFSAYISSNQSIPNLTFTKIQFNTEVFDTDGTYDNSTNYRFTPGVAGKYYIFANVYMNTITDGKNFRADIYKNGASYVFGRNNSSKTGSSISVNISFIDDASATDYYEIFVYHDEGSNLNAASGRRTSFGASKIIT